ncbi:MAG: ATPase, partial [Cytophagales bacterium]|nr:ATPase [Rhizobacter sp.]
MVTTTPAFPSGLTQQQALARQQEEGFNALPQTDRRTLWRIALEVVREPMFQLLVGAGVIYLLLGDLGEALMLLGFVAITVTITIVQEKRTERLLESLRSLSSPHALVLRDGQRQRVPGRDVVRGDVIVLSEGELVPADARLFEARDLLTDESLLTGEA